MLHKTKGVVLYSLPYNDKYFITSIYTEEFGRVSYLVSDARGKRAKVSRALLLPLSILDLEVEHINSRDIQRIKEAKSGYPAMQLHCDPVKGAVALFLSEALYRLLQERETNPRLFHFLCNSIHCLEIVSEGVANFHIAFLIRLSAYLGIHPNRESYKAGCFFDLLNGVFIEDLPAHSYYLDKDASLVFERLLRMSYENMMLYAFSRQERATIIRYIISYYRLHLPAFPDIKSLAVMQSVFDAG